MGKILIVDAEAFKRELVEDLRKILPRQQAEKQWLRSADVREMLNVSDSTLQTLRINRTIPAYQLGKTWFYKYDEIMSVLEAGKMNGGSEDE